MEYSLQEQKENLLQELEKLHRRHELAGTMGPEFFEPGLMEYPAQSDGAYSAETGEIWMRFEVKGTRYEGRTERIEKVRIGDTVQVVRDRENPYNANNFMILTARGKNLGNMPAQLCNAIAPLFDSGNLSVSGSEVSFVEPISRRSRHSKQAILFVELRLRLDI